MRQYRQWYSGLGRLMVIVLVLAMQAKSEGCPRTDPCRPHPCPPSDQNFPFNGHTATLLPNGKVLVAGGSDYVYLAYKIKKIKKINVTGSSECDSAPSLTNAWLYDPARNTWSPAAAMAYTHDGATATLLPSGKVLVVGGGEYGSDTTSAELYDPARNTWSSAAATSNLHRHTATLLPSGKVLVVGGYDFAHSSHLDTGKAYLYDPQANAWSPAQSPKTDRRGGHTATLLRSGKVLVAGGRGDFFSHDDVSSAEVYDPATNTWSPAGSMQSGRSGHTATLLPSGIVLVAGDDVNAELYDPQSNTWSRAGSMKVGRARHTATRLPSGKVLVAGSLYFYTGASPEEPKSQPKLMFPDSSPSYAGASSAEYDPQTNAWSPASSMQIGRYGHTATLLPSGKVLVVGGVGQLYDERDNTAATNAELYDPARNRWSFTAPMTTERKTSGVTPQ